jgi:hypothetical protein
MTTRKFLAVLVGLRDRRTGKIRLAECGSPSCTDGPVGFTSKRDATFWQRGYAAAMSPKAREKFEVVSIVAQSRKELDDLMNEMDDGKKSWTPKLVEVPKARVPIFTDVDPHTEKLARLLAPSEAVARGFA